MLRSVRNCAVNLHSWGLVLTIHALCLSKMLWHSVCLLLLIPNEHCSHLSLVLSDSRLPISVGLSSLHNVLCCASEISWKKFICTGIYLLPSEIPQYLPTGHTRGFDYHITRSGYTHTWRGSWR